MPARITLPQHQLLIHERRSPRDLPSSESFTRSQEGDDELSEASAPDDTEHRPGASSFYLKHGNASQTNQNPAAIDNVPKSPRKTSSTNTHVGSREEIQTPRSASSSNKTPTQANFTDISQPAMPSHSPGAVDKSYTQHRNSDNSAGYANAQASPTKFSPPQSRYSTQFPINIDVSNGHDSDSETPQRSSRESENVSHSAGSAADHLDLSAPMSETSIRHTTSINEQHGRDIYKPEHLRFRTDAQNSRGSLSKVRPISPMNESLNPLHQPHEYLPGSSSMKNMPSRVNAGQPPSPVSPWRPPEKNEILEQRGRRGPVHYGIGHDFGPPSEPERSRSCSYSRQLRDSRRSQDSRSSQDPNFREYPAFWQGGPAVSGSVIPLQFNAGQSTHEEALNSYQQTPQNQLDGIGPPVGRRSESRSRSRRGSRSSAFFKSFVSPSRSEIPPLPNGPDSQASSSAVNPPATDDRWSKRSSIFRSLTRNNDNGSGGRLSKETGRPHDSLTHVAQQAGPDTPRHVGKASYSIDGSSRLSKKLQRASKSAKPEQDTGQKRRFSAIVVSIRSPIVK